MHDNRRANPTANRIWLLLSILPLIAPVAVRSARAVNPSASPVVATIQTTLTTSGSHVRQYAFDGDPDSFFASVEKPGTADHFTLLFDQPVAVKSIGVVTGRTDGSDLLDAGVLDISADRRVFVESAQFAKGKARIELSGKPVQAVRITPGKNLKHALAIREIKITSDPPVATFRYPVEFIVDVSDAPEMRSWAEHVAEVCERSYPMLNNELKSDGYKPPALVTMTLKKSYRGVAAASGNHITGSVTFFKDHPHDVGAMVHETAHVVQHYRGRRNPGWLVEGVADYVRFFKFEPERIGPINADRARYNGSYRVSAAFLNYLSAQYDKQIVPKLNRVMREGNYDEKVFQELTGKNLQNLDEAWRKTLRR